VRGVVRTRVGYTGGKLKTPTYHHLGGHSESVQLDFDPAKVNYARLLKIFWQSHNPVHRAWSRQYMSAVFYHNRGQMRQAQMLKKRLEADGGKKLFTEILPAGTFYLAENYHQKYQLRRHKGLMQEFLRIYPDTRRLIDSTAATRVNSYLGGEGSRQRLEAEIDAFGLSAAGQKTLLALVRR